MTRQQPTQPVNRRSFLKALAATATAATAVGAGAGWLNGRVGNAPATFTVSGPPSAPANAPVIPPPAFTPAPATNGDALAQMAAVQAENVRLRSELDAAQRTLTALHQSQSDDVTATQQLQTQLAESKNQVGVLGGLLALYQQLDDLGIDETVEEGLSAVGSAFDNLMNQMPGAADGLALGQELLGNLEAHMPLLENGRAWLAGHLGRVEQHQQAVEVALVGAVETAGALLIMLNDWFQSIAKWLPFGMGRTAAQVMESITLLLGETPNTITGLRSNVAQPLDMWLGAPGTPPAESPLRRDIVKPIREQALQPAADALQQTQTVQTAFQSQLAQPTRTAAEQRRQVRQMIDAYRQQHQI